MELEEEREEKGWRRKKEEAIKAPRRMKRNRCSRKRYEMADLGKELAGLLPLRWWRDFIMAGCLCDWGRQER